MVLHDASGLDDRPPDVAKVMHPFSREFLFVDVDGGEARSCEAAECHDATEGSG